VKTCYTCHEEKPVSEFTRRKPGGAYRSSCKVCWNRRERLRNNSNKEKHRVAAVKEKEAIERYPNKYFIGQILLSGKGDDEFCESEWFTALCETAGWESSYIRRIMC
jgi:hypothetical protein